MTTSISDWSALPDIVHASGNELPRDLTPPSQRMHTVPNRKGRRAVERKRTR